MIQILGDLEVKHVVGLMSMIQILGALKVKHVVGLPDCAKIAVDKDGVICVALNCWYIW